MPNINTIFIRNSSRVEVPEHYQGGQVLDFFPRRGVPSVSVNLHRLIEHSGRPTEAAVDLLLLSASVYIADKCSPRVDAEDDWTRSFKLGTPVADTERWSTSAEDFVEGLTFLTGDRWSFEWRAERNRLWDAKYVNRIGFDGVCLFSGGLDSLVGAINLLEDRSIRRLLLVNHYDSNASAPLPRELGSALAATYGSDRVRLVQVRVRPTRTKKRPNIHGSVRESTTRSRSLLFLALALAAASAHGPSIPVYLPENGFIALNVPLTPARLGSCSTRTTHPYFLDCLQAALGSQDIHNPLVNPFGLLTKGQMLNGCRNPSLLRELAPKTISCAHAEVGRWEGRPYGNCGYCYPCIIRRAAMYAAGVPDTAYNPDLLSQPDLLKSNSDRVRDIRAILMALYRDRSNHLGNLMPLLSGPLNPPNEARRYGQLYREGIEELRGFVFSSTLSEVHDSAGL
jgi:7-cyano-7-deazaguanine synthase in queuosine biosynthesis